MGLTKLRKSSPHVLLILAGLITILVLLALILVVGASPARASEVAPAPVAQGVTPFCGNKTCDSNEDCQSCPSDCGACGPTCGDGVCDSGEDCSNCERDCGACQDGGGAECGNEIVESGEACDGAGFDGGNCGPGTVCSGCQCVPGTCGDFTWDTSLGEQCDGGLGCPEGVACTANCTCETGPPACQVTSCPTGQHFDTGRCACVPDQQGCQQVATCPAGQVFDTGRCACVPGECEEQTCPNGQKFDLERCACVPGECVEETCPEGETFDIGQCACVPGDVCQPDDGQHQGARDAANQTDPNGGMPQVFAFLGQANGNSTFDPNSIGPGQGEEQTCNADDRDVCDCWTVGARELNTYGGNITRLSLLCCDDDGTCDPDYGDGGCQCRGPDLYCYGILKEANYAECGGCQCDGADLYCNGQLTEANSRQCGGCECVGPDLFCGGELSYPGHPKCSQGVNCSCDGPDLFCDDGTVEVNSPKCGGGCECQGVDLVCNGQVAETNSQQCGGCECLGPDLICGGQLAQPAYEECLGGATTYYDNNTEVTCECVGPDLFCGGQLTYPGYGQCSGAASGGGGTSLAVLGGGSSAGLLASPLLQCQPQECDAGQHFDTGQCACVPDTGDQCYPPPSCGPDQYLDWASCSCMPQGEQCIPETCPTGQHFDKRQCACVPDDGACEPTQCAENQYFDTQTCRCEPRGYQICTCGPARDFCRPRTGGDCLPRLTADLPNGDAILTQVYPVDGQTNGATPASGSPGMLASELPQQQTMPPLMGYVCDDPGKLCIDLRDPLVFRETLRQNGMVQDYDAIVLWDCMEVEYTPATTATPMMQTRCEQRPLMVEGDGTRACAPCVGEWCGFGPGRPGCILVPHDDMPDMEMFSWQDEYGMMVGQASTVDTGEVWALICPEPPTGHICIPIDETMKEAFRARQVALADCMSGDPNDPSMCPVMDQNFSLEMDENGMEYLCFDAGRDTGFNPNCGPDPNDPVNGCAFISQQGAGFNLTALLGRFGLWLLLLLIGLALLIFIIIMALSRRRESY